MMTLNTVQKVSMHSSLSYSVNVECKCSVQRISPYRHVAGVLEFLLKQHGCIEHFLQLVKVGGMYLCVIFLDLSELVLLGLTLCKRYQSYLDDSLILCLRKMYGVYFVCWIPLVGLLWTSRCDSRYDRR